MQLNSVYLYPNKVDVFTNLGEWSSGRYRKVYQRNFKVYRGVDNRLDLQVRNADEKAKDITGNSLVFTLLERDTQKIILQRTCTIVSEAQADSTIKRNKGFVVITEADLILIDKGFYNYTLHLRDALTNAKTPLYCDSQFGVIGTLEVEGNLFGETIPPVVIDTFTVIPTTWLNINTSYSELIYANPETSSASTVHTFTIEQRNYKGLVVIEASTEEGATPSSGKWTDIATLNYPAVTNQIQVTGKWNWFRIKHIPTVATFGVSPRTPSAYDVRIVNAGKGYTIGNQFVIDGTELFGTGTVNDLTITVTGINADGGITSVTHTGVSVLLPTVQYPIFPIGYLDKVTYR
jgi:hypothetical protein